MKIVSRYNASTVLYECEAASLREAVEKAVKSGANLIGANLDGANLNGANLNGATLYGATLIGANLSGAILSGANLIGANLSGAYLIGATLSGAYLIGATWTDGVSLKNNPIHVGGLHYPVRILDTTMKIGCQYHSLKAWEAFDDKAILEMDGKTALRFWRQYKQVLLSLSVRPV